MTTTVGLGLGLVYGQYDLIGSLPTGCEYVLGFIL